MTWVILPASRLIAWSGLGAATNLAVRRLYSSTAVVCRFNSALSGIATAITFPSSRLLGEVFFFGSPTVVGLGLRGLTPFALATSRRLPSGATTTDVGYHPAGTYPSSSLSGTSITATAFMSPSVA